MEMSYYCAANRDGDIRNNARARRKEDLVAERAEDPEEWDRNYGPIVKMDFEYYDGFDLLNYCLFDPDDVERDAWVAMMEEER